MSVPAGRHRVGANRDRLVLHTGRDGLAASAGHDLTIELTDWSAQLTVGEDSVPTALEATIDMTSLTVREGSGGIKPLTDKDRRDIKSQARKILSIDQHPQATFGDAKFQPDGTGSGTISGTFTIAGRSGPLTLQVTQIEPDHYRARGSVVQSAFGIKPYSGFFGALKVRDRVDVEVEVDLSQPAGA
ncbi:MAG TPA: YceI family protein [Streptosporangiaceae bacterium]|nr:YceI family protein [Streptosporangiaceae bacterium]